MKSGKQFIISCIGILTIGAFVILSCKKSTIVKPVIISEDATVINTGDPAYDGCGWQIKTAITDSSYNAPNLTAQFEVANLKVHIAYHKLVPRFRCGWNTVGITEIQLDTIRAK